MKYGSWLFLFGLAILCFARGLVQSRSHRALVNVIEAKRGSAEGKRSKDKKQVTRARTNNKTGDGNGGNFLSKVAAGLVAGAIALGGSIFGFGFGSDSGVNFGDKSGIFMTANDIPKQYYKDKKMLYGQVVKVVDGDTLRMRHLPTSMSSGELPKAGKLKDQTIMVRVAAVDSPETAKFGQDGQPFGDEAKEFTTRAVLNKRVKVKALAKDRYDRLLGVVTYDAGSFGGEKDLSEELLRQGLAVVYTQGGAQYDGRREEFVNLEAEARKNKRGLWSQKNGGESPADYKKKMKNVKKR